MSAGPGPSIGVEVELATFGPGRPVGSASSLPAMMISGARRRLATLLHHERAAVWTCAGLFYHEMHRFLEAASWPAGDLESFLRAEDAALHEALGFLRELGPAAPADTVMACYADDLSGCAVVLQSALLQNSSRDAGEQPRSRSMGTHVNLHVGRDVFGDGPPCGADSFVLLACLLPEIVGPGGFVRHPATGRLEFWRDPRAAHTGIGMISSAHYAVRPVLKTTSDHRRVQIVSLGWTASRVDRLVKYGLLLLLASAVCGWRAPPKLRVTNVAEVLHALPGQTIELATPQGTRRGSRLDFLEELLDRVLEPESQRPEGAALGCAGAVCVARRLVGLLRGGADVAEIARQVPASWALKQQAFAGLCRDEGFELPVPGGTAAAAEDGLLSKLALLAIRESDLASDGVKRWLLDRLPGRPWSFEAIYAPDPLAVRAVRERRVPPGMLPVAAAIAAALEPPGQADPGCFGTWQGPMPRRRGLMGRVTDAIRPPIEPCPEPPSEDVPF